MASACLFKPLAPHTAMASTSVVCLNLFKLGTTARSSFPFSQSVSFAGTHRSKELLPLAHIAGSLPR